MSPGAARARRPPAAAVVRGLCPFAPLVLFLGVVLVAPVLRVVAWGVADPEAWRELLGTPLYREALARTVRISVTVTGTCLVLGLPVAYVLARAPGRGGRLLLALVVIPFWASLLARSFTWMVLLQRQGVVNRLLVATGVVQTPVPLVYNEIGVHVGMVHVLLPFMILSLYATARGVDPVLLRAARSLGATEWQAFRRVFWPLVRPGVAAGVLLLFVVGLGFFITPALLGGGKVTTVAMLIEAHVAQAQNWPLASLLAVFLLVATAIVLLPVQRALRLDAVLGGGR